MQRNASNDNTTTRVRRSTRWEIPGLAKIGIVSMSIGALALAGVFVEGRDSPVGVRIIEVAVLVLAATLVLGGLQAIRWGVSAAKGREREHLVDLDLYAIQTAQGQLVEKQVRIMADARERLDRMERMLLTVTASLRDAERFGDRLTAIERGLDTIARAVREAADRQSAEASRTEVRLDALGKQLACIAQRVLNKDEIVAELCEQVRGDLREEMADALLEARALGFVDALDGRPLEPGNVRRLPGPDQR